MVFVVNNFVVVVAVAVVVDVRNHDPKKDINKWFISYNVLKKEYFYNKNQILLLYFLYKSYNYFL